MISSIRVPKLGMTQQDISVVKWLKEDGGNTDKGQGVVYSKRGVRKTDAGGGERNGPVDGAHDFSKFEVNQYLTTDPADVRRQNQCAKSPELGLARAHARCR